MTDKQGDSIKVCANCKHWDNKLFDNPRDNYANWFDDKERAGTTDDQFGFCAYSGPLMIAICDGEGILGELITRDIFSCAGFEQKSEKVNLNG